MEFDMASVEIASLFLDSRSLHGANDFMFFWYTPRYSPHSFCCFQRSYKVVIPVTSIRWCILNDSLQHSSTVLIKSLIIGESMLLDVKHGTNDDKEYLLFRAMQ